MIISIAACCCNRWRNAGNVDRGCTAGAVSTPFRSLSGIWWGGGLGFIGLIVVGEGRRDYEVQVLTR